MLKLPSLLDNKREAQSFPYSNFDQNELVARTNITEFNLLVQNTVLNTLNNHFVDISIENILFLTDIKAIMLSIQYLKDNNHFDFKNANEIQSKFVDCTGLLGSNCFYASTLGFNHLISVEYNGFNHDLVKNIFKQLKQENKSKFVMKKFEFKCGSIQDYFVVDADVFFYNTVSMSMGLSLHTVINKDNKKYDNDIIETDENVDMSSDQNYANLNIDNNSIIDEGILLSCFFDMCRKLLPGVFIIIISSSIDLSTAGCQQMGFPHLQFVNRMNINGPEAENSMNNSNSLLETNEKYPLDLWILKTVGIKKSK
eukprot:gene4854-6804_t